MYHRWRSGIASPFVGAVNKTLFRVGFTLMLTLQIGKLSIELRGWGK